MSSGAGKSAFTPITIKQESLDSNGIRMEKLTSFKVPRDLTLGGAGPLRQRGGPNKKVYAPNLNVTRNKNSNVKTAKDTSARGRPRAERGKSERGRGRGGGRGGSNLIQTSGLFSEGAGAIQLKRSSSSSSYRSSADGEDTGGLRRPTLIKREGKIDASADNQRIKDILGDSDEDDFNNMKTDLEYVPIKLSEGENDPIAEKLNHMNIKPESDSIKQKYPLSIEEFLTRTQPQIFLLQLPDSLPCQEAEEISTEPNSSKESQLEQKTNITNCGLLKQMEEGQIGKILRYKSGKYKLVLGETRFDLDLGMEAGFFQQLVSINANREERSGNMINLGMIQAKVTATPDWEYLFKNNS